MIKRQSRRRRRYNGLYRTPSPQQWPRPSSRLSLSLSGFVPAPARRPGLLEILCPHCFNAEKKEKLMRAAGADDLHAGDHNGAKIRRYGCRRSLTIAWSGRTLLQRVRRVFSSAAFRGCYHFLELKYVINSYSGNWS